MSHFFLLICISGNFLLGVGNCKCSVAEFLNSFFFFDSVEVGSNELLRYLEISLMFLRLTFKLCWCGSTVASIPGLV